MEEFLLEHLEGCAAGLCGLTRLADDQDQRITLGATEGKHNDLFNL